MALHLIFHQLFLGPWSFKTKYVPDWFGQRDIPFLSLFNKGIYGRVIYFEIHSQTRL